MRFLERFFGIFISLKLAVFVIVVLVFSLTAATILESVYDTPTAQFHIYRSLWFQAILGVLGINILCVALSRYPWKRRHLPFLMAHLGILMLLIGAWVTQRYGLDGMLRVSEGETTGSVGLDSQILVVSEGGKVAAVPVPWVPPHSRFRPISLRDYGVSFDLSIDQYLTHAEPSTSFLPSTDVGNVAPALHLKITGGPMRVSQDFWIWAGDPSSSVLRAGPARLAIGQRLQPMEGQPSISFESVSQGGIVGWESWNSEGQVRRGRISSLRVNGFEIDPGWKGGVKINLLEWVPAATARVTYAPSRMEYGLQAPPSAIHLTAGSGKESSVWLGLGERTVLSLDGRDVELAYLQRRVVLPFSVSLERFNIEHYEGTSNPASYSSKVSIPGEPGFQNVVISMNEPLEFKGTTLYQASYEEADPRPVTSIFSVNRDPGRSLKYLGSILIVLGSIWLFFNRYRKIRTLRK